MAKLFSQATYQALDSNGDPLSGAKWNFYLTLTSTRHDTFTDNALSVAHANPVVADSSGRFAPVYLQDADYKAVLTEADDTVIQTVDPVHGAEAVDPADLTTDNVFTKTTTWRHGIDVASAAALTLGDGNIFDITGTTDITSIVTKGVGTIIVLQFDDVLTVTHNATDLVLPGGANIDTTAGDVLIFEEYATGDWRLISRESVTSLTTTTKTSNYTVLITDKNRTILVDATTVVPWAAGIQEDSSGSSFIDETTDLNDAGASDVALFPAGAGLNDAFYFGLGDRFPLVTMNVGTVGTGTYLVFWEYWNGTSWTALSDVVDGTTAFKTTGTNDVTFTVPSNWATTTINSQGPFFYVRARRDSGTVTADPLGTQAFAGLGIVLPSVTSAGDGFTITLVKKDSTVNVPLLVAVGGDLINAPGGARTSVALPSQFDSIKVISDGTVWFVTEHVLTFESTQQTISNAGTLTIAHGLGVRPDNNSAWAVCLTAEYGYSIGDRLPVPITGGVDATSAFGFVVVPDATNLNVKFGAVTTGPLVLRFDTGAQQGLTFANWELVFKSWL